jgi:hypothetical protein
MNRRHIGRSIGTEVIKQEEDSKQLNTILVTASDESKSDWPDQVLKRRQRLLLTVTRDRRDLYKELYHHIERSEGRKLDLDLLLLSTE